MAETRPRKACLNCYEKKIRCDWPTDSIVCSRCLKHSLQCFVPEPKVPNQRSSMRDLLYDIENRVRALEEKASSPVARSNSRAILGQTASSLIIPGSGKLAEGLSHGLYDGSSASTSTQAGSPAWPWQDLRHSLRQSPIRGPYDDDVRRLIKQEISVSKPALAIPFDLLSEFPLFQDDLVYVYADKYASEAPFVLLSWPGLQRDIQQLLQFKACDSAGQIVCILMYLTFGSANSDNAPYPPNVLLDKAMTFLPQLIMQHDIWAVMGILLMVHWLQGMSEPESCFSLLAIVTRMAVGLKLHKAEDEDSGLDPLRREEATRAWWLCYILELTFSVIFGRHNAVSDISVGCPLPAPFPASNGLTGTQEYDDPAAVDFFRDLVQVMRERDHLLSRIAAQSTLDAISEISRFEPREQLDVAPNGPLRAKLRYYILTLVKYNAIIVLDRRSRGSTPLGPSEQALAASRNTIRLIAEGQREGIVHCFWMFLYYSFSASVTLFHDITYDPRSKDAALNLALIADIENLCMSMSAVSPGAKRVGEACVIMGRVGIEIMKSDAKQQSRKRARRSSLGAEPAAKHAHHQSSLSAQEESSQAPDRNGTVFVSDTAGAREYLPEVPLGFDWDQWNQWLQTTEIAWHGSSTVEGLHAGELQHGRSAQQPDTGQWEHWEQWLQGSNGTMPPPDEGA